MVPLLVVITHCMIHFVNFNVDEGTTVFVDV